MKLLCLAILSALFAVNEAITFSTVATVSLTLISLNKPVSCFFGIFRRRKSPIQETVAMPEAQPPFMFPNQPMSGFNPFGSGGFGAGGFNPFASGGFGAGGFNPFASGGFGAGGLGMFQPSNRFPPKPASPGRPQQQKPIPMMPPHPVQQQFAPQHQQSMMSSESGFRDPREDSPGMNTEEAESFFTLLSETDESKCISRLVCEMGASPDSGGEFGQTVVEIIGSLNDFPDGSKVSEYNEVLSTGMAEGLSACMSKFAMCDEESYQLVKKAQLDNEE